jgi:uncharacterized membrane protein (Fun14 family)
MAADRRRHGQHEGDHRQADRGSPTPVKKHPWQLQSVRIAIAITLLGAGMWVYALATQPAAPSSSNGGTRDISSGITSGFAAGGDRNTLDAATGQAPKRAVDSAAPATLRIGASFLAAFALGMIMRKFVRWSLLIVGIAVIAIFFLRKSGMIDMPWDRIEDEVHHGATWLQAQAGSIKDFLTGYLPSGAAALVGGFIGFRRG